jgi:hypothetical protein
MIRKAGLALLFLCLFNGLAAFPAVAAKDEQHLIEIAGKVTDERKAPVKRALVILTDRDHRTTQKTRTDGHGHFMFSHLPSGGETLQVIPAVKSGLAQAVLTDVPGDEGRHVLISVRKGFLVKGRVVSGDQALKNVTVRVITHDGDNVHGGGEDVTDGKGAFALVLTPGQKTVEVTDITNPQLVGSYKQKYNVTADGTMPDLKVPASRPAGTIK